MPTNNFIEKNEKRKLILLFSLWWTIWVVMQAAVLKDIGLPISQAVVDAFLSNLLLAAFCMLIINNMRYYLPKHEKYFYLLFICIALSAIWLLMLRLSLWGLYKNEETYMQWLRRSSTLRYSFGFLMIGCISMLSLLWFSQREQKEENERRLDTERIAKDTELNKLRQQLQPHFLFNSLNSISALTGTQPEKARMMIQQLSDLLRSSLKIEENIFTIFEEELKYLQLYLEIEKVRFGHRLQTQINYDETILQMKLPSMILQPLVENAIKFGLYDTLGEVVITIDASIQKNLLKVIVTNPFDASTSMPVKGAGFGLSSIKRRLFLLFARHDLLQTEQSINQFTTTIQIPQIG